MKSYDLYISRPETKTPADPLWFAHSDRHGFYAACKTAHKAHMANSIGERIVGDGMVVGYEAMKRTSGTKGAR